MRRNQISYPLCVPNGKYNLDQEKLVKFFLDRRLQTRVHFPQFLLIGIYLRFHGDVMMHDGSIESPEFIICPGKNVFKFPVQFNKTSSFIMGTMYSKIDKSGFMLCSQIDRCVIQG